MTAQPDSSKLLAEAAQIVMPVQVRYCECDPQGLAHHSVFPIWLEMARCEMLRQMGTPYSQLEQQGIYFVVARMSFRFRRPARFEDMLDIVCRALPVSGVKIEHEYEIRCNNELLATAQTTLVCVNQHGRPQPIPPHVFQSARKDAESTRC